MIGLLFFALVTIGFTNMLVHGRILDLIPIRGKSVREWMHYWDWSKQLFSCYECTGFWAGLIWGYFLISHQWWLILASGFAGSVIAYAFYTINMLIESKVEFEVDTDEGDDESREN